jgi:hypothetical protein
MEEEEEYVCECGSSNIANGFPDLCVDCYHKEFCS